MKNVYVRKLLLNIIISGIEALVLGNKFCMPVSKKSTACVLSHVSSVKSSLLLKGCDTNQFFT
jgi:hypothetical protein